MDEGARRRSARDQNYTPFGVWRDRRAGAFGGKAEPRRGVAARGAKSAGRGDQAGVVPVPAPGPAAMRRALLEPAAGADGATAAAVARRLTRFRAAP